MSGAAPAGIGDRLRTLPQYLLPKRLLSSLMYRFTRVRWRPFVNLQISLFTRLFDVDLSQAEGARPGDYPDFNGFFTRALREGARPLPDAADAVACPVDGTLADVGTVDAGRLLQAKGHDYTLADLLGGDEAHARAFEGGHYATIYLSPRDYHRIHMPLAGRLEHTVHVPGDRFAVNAHTARAVAGLYTRNERVAALFDTEAGPMALVLVGALNVGSIDTVWPATQWQAPGESARAATPSGLVLERGAEMGRFNMGSTVVAVFAPGLCRLDPDLAAGQAVQMGQIIGTISTQKST